MLIESISYHKIVRSRTTHFTSRLFNSAFRGSMTIEILVSIFLVDLCHLVVEFLSLDLSLCLSQVALVNLIYFNIALWEVVLQIWRILWLIQCCAVLEHQYYIWWWVLRCCIINLLCMYEMVLRVELFCYNFKVLITV